ncbi:MAG: pseudouridine synthase, partial [Myxococcota bacterium]
MEHPHPLPPELLYIDEHLLAVHKPSGTLVHRGWGQEGPILVAQVRQLLQTDTAYPIHRLDRPTSGVVLFARDPTTAKLLNEAFDARTVGKH